MSAFWDRIRVDESAGTIFDGDRRYLLMRPDVLMGMLHELPADMHATVLTALGRSARKHGGKSVAAYLHAEGPARLQQSVIDGAAAFGWGKWRITQRDGNTELEVENSPFAAGYGPSGEPVCAPVGGIFHSLAQALMGGAVQVTETQCAARGATSCRFVARSAGPDRNPQSPGDLTVQALSQ
ncbi:V4R domain-containing protein [Massilia putida]|uniref:V4R domain-containing protein n=1 Tax=Massilia putida TaxID=1141883 RepID=UPI00095200F4|nr:4-vinyl reductase [Massilia putida]